MFHQERGPHEGVKLRLSCMGHLPVLQYAMASGLTISGHATDLPVSQLPEIQVLNLAAKLLVALVLLLLAANSAY